MNREKQLLKNTAILALGTVLPKLAAFVTLPIYTSALTRQEYGAYDLINVLVALFIPIVSFQVHRAVFRFLLKAKSREESKGIISSAVAFLLPVMLVSLLVLYGSLRANGFAGVISLLVCLYFFVSILMDTALFTARGLGENKKYAVSAILSTALNLVLVLWLVLGRGRGLPGLLTALVVSNSMALVYLIATLGLYRYIARDSVDRRTVGELLRYGLPMIPSTISLWVINASNRLIITAQMGIAANAVFAVAGKIPQMVSIAYNSFNMAWQESASVTVEQRDSDQYFSKVIDQLFNVMAGMTAMLLGVLPAVFALLVDSSYSEAYSLVPYLIIGAFFSSMSSYYGGIYVSLLKTTRIGLSAFVGAVLNVTLSLLLMPRLGLRAAAIASLASNIALTVYRMIDVGTMRKISYRWGKIAAALLVITAMALCGGPRLLWLDIANFLAGVVFAIALNREIIRQGAQLVLGKMRRGASADHESR